MSAGILRRLAVTSCAAHPTDTMRPLHRRLSDAVYEALAAENAPPLSWLWIRVSPRSTEFFGLLDWLGIWQILAFPVYAAVAMLAFRAGISRRPLWKE